MYTRDVIESFLQTTTLSREEKRAIMRRAALAADGASSVEDGYFAADKLATVLGQGALVRKFEELWNSGQLVKD